MSELPVEIQKKLTRAIGVYLKATPANELPGPLKALRNFTPSALANQRSKVLNAAEDAGLRARIVEWLDDGKTHLSKDDAALLRAFAERSEGWEAEIATTTPPRPTVRKTEQEREARHRERLEREKDKTRRAKEDAHKARAEAQRAVRDAEREAASLGRRATDLAAKVERLEVELENVRRARDAAADRLNKEQRKARRAVETAQSQRDKARADLKAERRKSRELEAKLARRAAESAPRPKVRRAPQAKKAPQRAGRRRPLQVPKGRPGNDPDTLDEWLFEDDVHLLIDGYNVTKALGGYGSLSLERQRERLVQDVGTLARRRKVGATIVFDGAILPPGTVRRTRSPVVVEYSTPPENADDHLIARLKTMPPDPVIVVTNDKELQGRAARLGATVATSNQLLAMIRP